MFQHLHLIDFKSKGDLVKNPDIILDVQMGFWSKTVSYDATF